MKKTPVEILDFYDEEITGLISTKYGFTPIDSLRRFLNSEIFTMLYDAELEAIENAFIDIDNLITERSNV